MARDGLAQRPSTVARSGRLAVRPEPTCRLVLAFLAADQVEPCVSICPGGLAPEVFSSARQHRRPEGRRYR